MSKFDDKYRSESHRWQYWDYSAPGNYFLTVNVLNRQCILGDINNKKMELSQYGTIVTNHIQKIPTYHQRIMLDAYVIMPDHFHLLVTLKDYDFDNGLAENNGRIFSVASDYGRRQGDSVNTIHELYLRNHPDPSNDEPSPNDKEKNSRPIPDAHLYWYQKQQSFGFQPTETEVKEYREHRRQMIISKMIGKLKMQVSKEINRQRKTPGVKNWLANYHDRVIRTEEEYQNVKKYILENPKNWDKEK